jgi:HAD superfamily hydrolase (TIGR01484 family)
MRPLVTAPRDELERIEGLFFDLDDTLLSHGVLTLDAYRSLWDLRAGGLRLVAVTGRPAGWAEVFVRQWPIDGAVTENGAVAVVREGRGVRLLFDGSPAEVAARRDRLDALVNEVSSAMPDLDLADDVAARRSDVAWDIGERVSIAEDRIAALSAIIRAAGARTTRSSVHVHATFERDDKASGAFRFARERFGADPGRIVSRWAFIGDSANDAACFSALRLTFGVANVRAFFRQMNNPPRWIAEGERGEGFAEIARLLLAARS